MERERRKHSERDMRETIRNCEEHRHRCSKTVVKKRFMGEAKTVRTVRKLVKRKDEGT